MSKAKKITKSAKAAKAIVMKNIVIILSVLAVLAIILGLGLGLGLPKKDPNSDVVLHGSVDGLERFSAEIKENKFCVPKEMDGVGTPLPESIIKSVSSVFGIDGSCSVVPPTTPNPECTNVVYTPKIKDEVMAIMIYSYDSSINDDKLKKVSTIMNKKFGDDYITFYAFMKNIQASPEKTGDVLQIFVIKSSKYESGSMLADATANFVYGGKQETIDAILNSC